MDTATLNAIISGSAALLGAAIGGLTTYFTGARQHKRQIEKEEEQARREREHNAAKESEALCIQMTDAMEKARHPASKQAIANDRRAERVNDAYKKISAITLYLPTDLQHRIDLLADIIRSADDLSYGSNTGDARHYHQPYTICWHVRQEIRALVAAFIKGEQLPSPGDFIAEYKQALQDLHEDEEEFYSYLEEVDPSQKSEQEARKAFYKRHPDIKQIE